MLIPDPALAQTTYHLAAPCAPWLWPLLAVTGLAAQFCALVFKKRLLVLAGVALVTVAAWPERDASLLVGDLLLGAALWRWLRK